MAPTVVASVCEAEDIGDCIGFRWSNCCPCDSIYLCEMVADCLLGLISSTCRDPGVSVPLFTVHTTDEEIIFDDCSIDPDPDSWENAPWLEFLLVSLLLLLWPVQYQTDINNSNGGIGINSIISPRFQSLSNIQFSFILIVYRLVHLLC